MADSVEPEPPPPPPEVEVAVTQPVTPIPSAIPAGAPPPRQSCWEKRSKMEKVLIVFLIILLIVCLAVVAIFLIYFYFAVPPEGQCLTNTCMRLATAIESKMDKTIDPCNNFYEYACGGWIKKTPLRPSEIHQTTMSNIIHETETNIKSLLEMKSTGDPFYVQQTKVFYSACMNVEYQKERGVMPFMKILKGIGKLPSLDPSWNETDFDLEDMLIKLRRLRLAPLIDFGVQREKESVNILYVDTGYSPVDLFKAPVNGSIANRYEEVGVDVLVKLGANRTTAESDMKEAFDLDRKINKLRDNDGPSDNPISLLLMNNKYPWLNWHKLFQGILGTSGAFYIGVEERINNRASFYLEKLGPLLNSTSKRVVVNFLMSSLLRYAKFIIPEFEEIFDKQETSADKPPQRWKFCTEMTSAIFPESVSRMYIDQHFSNASREYLKSMVGDLTEAFTQLLEDNEWMSSETKKKTVAKLKSMKAMIGYPDHLMDNARLNSRYISIPTKETEYIETLLAGEYFKTQEEFKELREPKDPTKLDDATILPSPRYSVFGNEIEYALNKCSDNKNIDTSIMDSQAGSKISKHQKKVPKMLPAALLQKPVFNPEFSSSQMLGATGSYISRLIVKSLAEVNVSKNGESNDWWTKVDKTNFESRSSCFVDQYGCFKWDGHSLDGEKTLAENIADNGGLKQSYRAYRNFVRRRGAEELKLPGLQLNHDQVFFLSFAQLYCGKTDDKAKEMLIKGSQHSPYPYRVIGSLQNSVEFAHAFSCKAGSRMNPLRKCVIW